MRSDLIIETIVVGIITLVFFYTLKFFLKNVSLPILLFCTGALFHFTLEVLGLNKYWCTKTF